MPFIVGAMVLTPIALAAWFFCRLARKHQISWKWALAACVLLGVLAGPSMIDVGIRGTYPSGMLHGSKVTSPTAKQAQGFLMFGFGLSKHPSLAQIAQFALPLTIAAWAICRQGGLRRSACAS